MGGRKNFIFVIGLILILSFSFVSAGFFQDVLGKINGKWGDSSDCYDSDGGEKIFISGYVRYPSEFTMKTTSDFCSDSKTLVEGVCSGDTYYDLTRNCQYGCREGKCLQQSSCFDNDGEDYYRLGMVDNVLEEVWDYCLDSSMLVEGVCSEYHKYETNKYVCPNGCLGGVCLERSETCSDSDGGDNSGLKGVVEDPRGSFEDYCKDEKILVEGNCFSNFYAGVEEECSNGCEDGACVETLACSDTDGKYNFIKGKVTVGGNSFNDYCFGHNKLVEYYCGGNSEKYEEINCPCIGGICVDCSDSDGGKDYYVRGEIIDEFGNKGRDVCLGDGKSLVEYYCGGSKVEKEVYVCEFGCGEGVCKKNNLVGWTNWFNVDGSGGKGDYEMLSNYFIKSNVCLTPSAIECQTLSGVDYLKTGENVHVDLSKGCWCVNSEQSDGMCDYDYQVRFNCGVGGSSCVLNTCEVIGGRCGVIDDGCGGKLDCGNCSSGKYCEAGRCIVVPDVVPISCIDSDGGKDYFNQGVVDIRGDSQKDVCEGDVLVESFCEGLMFASEKYNCSYGCEVGACNEFEIVNKKDLSKYDEKGVFLISDMDWKSVLSLVPLTTWTRQDDSVKCEEGYGTAEGVCVYPTLVYHEESAKRFFNLASRAKILSSSNVGEHNALFVADENLLTTWNSGSSEKGFVILDLGKSEEINQIKIKGSAEPYFMNIYYASVPSVSDSDFIRGNEAFVSPYEELDKPGIISNLLVDNYILNTDSNVIDVNVEARYLKFEFVDNPEQRIYPNWKSVSEIEIYGDESFQYSGFDADSIVHFMQQFDAEKITLVGKAPQGVLNLLTAKPDFGVGFEIDDFSLLDMDHYLSYWDEYRDVVYVEDDYRLALMASTYASLINAPLIIEGTVLDNNGNFYKRNVICVGDLDYCDEKYSLEELEKKYVGMTNTDKVMLVNYNDLELKVDEKFKPSKSGGFIYDLYSKTSLVAPILASAKHELLIGIDETDSLKIGDFVKGKVYDLIPELINNPSGIPLEMPFPPKLLYEEDLVSGEENKIYQFISTPNIKGFEDRIFFMDLNYLYWQYVPDGDLEYLYDEDSRFIDYSFSNNKLFYSKFNYKSNICSFNLLDFDSLNEEVVYFFEDTMGYCYSSSVSIDGNLLSWNRMGYSDNFIYVENFVSGERINFSVDRFTTELFVRGKNIFWKDWAGLNVYDINSGNKEKIISKIQFFDISEDNLMFVKETSIGSKVYELFLYNLITGEKKLIDENIFFDTYFYPSIFGKNIVWADKGDFAGGVCEDNFKISCNVNTGEGCPITGEKCLANTIVNYNILEGDKKVISEGKLIKNFLNLGDKLYFIYSQKNYFLNGFLTIFSSPVAIPTSKIKRLVYYDVATALDQREYGDIYLDDGNSDLAVGRIQGITLSDVSGYVARDLFYDVINEPRKISILVGNSKVDDYNGAFKGFFLSAPAWSKIFRESGYFVDCVIGNSSSGDCREYADKNVEWIDSMKNKESIFIGNHGSGSGAGIMYNEIPEISGSIFYAHSCSTCSIYSGASFCNNAIRKGALGYVGVLSVTGSGNRIFSGTMGLVYGGDKTLGQAFTESYTKYQNKETTLIGDPTLDINPDYVLEGELR